MNAYGVDIESLFVKTLNDVLREAGIRIEELKQPTRRRDLCEQRQAIMYFAYTHHDYTLTEAGMLFYKDHSNVSHCKKQIIEELEILQKQPTMKITGRLQLYNKLIAIKTQK